MANFLRGLLTRASRLSQLVLWTDVERGADQDGRHVDVAIRFYLRYDSTADTRVTQFLQGRDIKELGDMETLDFLEMLVQLRKEDIAE